MLILASGSSWKLDLLQRIGFEVIGVGHLADEDALVEADPKRSVRRIAEAKALSVEATAEAIVVGADQLLFHEGEVFGKAATAGEAHARLERLQGTRHTLLGGWAVVADRTMIASGVVESHLTMRPLDDAAISRYIATNEWQGSCGCYRYESIGRQLFSAVDGDYFSILGMPVEAILPVLRERSVPGAI